MTEPHIESTPPSERQPDTAEAWDVVVQRVVDSYTVLERVEYVVLLTPEEEFTVIQYLAEKWGVR